MYIRFLLVIKSPDFFTQEILLLIPFFTSPPSPNAYTDTLGLVLSCQVHSAGIQDRDGAKDVLAKAKAKYPTIVNFFADGGYTGAL